MGTGESGDWGLLAAQGTGLGDSSEHTSFGYLGACPGGLSLVSMSPVELGYDPVSVRGHLCGLCHVRVSGVWSSHKESE